ncbi:MAG: hypothetical protein JJU28_04560 [Cyclobacteriaceae bacterium]|nr:hypothetical protein [Cyclobacteriaceae bacterium]
MKEQIIELDFLELQYDHELDALIAIWKKSACDEEIHIAFSEILQAFQIYRANNYICEVHYELQNYGRFQEWILNDLIPKAVEIGMLRLAAVGCRATISRYFMCSDYRSVVTPRGTFILKCFEDVIEAESWIKTFNIQLTA